MLVNAGSVVEDKHLPDDMVIVTKTRKGTDEPSYYVFYSEKGEVLKDKSYEDLVKMDVTALAKGSMTSHEFFEEMKKLKRLSVRQ